MCAALLSLIHCNSSSSRFLVPFLFVPRTNHSLGSAVCVFSGCNSIAFCIHRRIAFIGIGRYRTNFVNSMQVCSTDSFFSFSLCVLILEWIVWMWFFVSCRCNWQWWCYPCFMCTSIASSRFLAFIYGLNAFSPFFFAGHDNCNYILQLEGGKMREKEVEGLCVWVAFDAINLY